MIVLKTVWTDTKRIIICDTTIHITSFEGNPNLIRDAAPQVGKKLCIEEWTIDESIPLTLKSEDDVLTILAEVLL